MTRSRVEGLLAGFPKLIKEGKQHTFVETDTVRYVYQPLELLYVVLITTKNSNILEDLETLRMFAKVVRGNFYFIFIYFTFWFVWFGLFLALFPSRSVSLLGVEPHHPMALLCLVLDD